jgi:hypothetical protein
MTQFSGSSYSVSPITLEFILVGISTVAAACWSRPDAPFFSRIERIFKPLARRRGLAVATVSLNGLLLPLAIPPF